MTLEELRDEYFKPGAAMSVEQFMTVLRAAEQRGIERAALVCFPTEYHQKAASLEAWCIQNRIRALAQGGE